MTLHAAVQIVGGAGGLVWRVGGKDIFFGYNDAGGYVATVGRAGLEGWCWIGGKPSIATGFNSDAEAKAAAEAWWLRSLAGRVGEEG